jgi:hypothetical protein
MICGGAPYPVGNEGILVRVRNTTPHSGPQAATDVE